MIIEANDNIPINFAAVGEMAIIQNVRMILSTPKYSVALDRNFGIDAALVDKPLPVAKAKITAEIIAAIQKYEPRVKVTKVLFAGDGADGILKPRVQVVILND